MSGVKESYVDVRESDFNRMMNGARLAEGFSSELNARISESNRRLQGEFRAGFADINRRQARFEQNLAGLSDGLQALERQQSQRIRDLNQRMEQGFENAARELGNLNQRMERGFAQTARELGALDRRMTDEVERLDSNIDQVQRNVEQLAERTEEALRSQRSEYISLIDEQGKIFQREIAEQNRIFTEAMSAQREELQGQIGQVAEHIRRREQSDRKAAATWLKDVRLLFDNIDQNTRHEKFKPGALTQIRTEFVLAENNLASGQDQAAIATAQTSYMKAHELQLELAQLEQEWNLHLMQARTSAAEVLAVCETRQAAKLTVETEEGSEEIAAEIDFWSQGRLSELRGKVEAENQRLAGQADTLTLDELKASIEQCAEWMRESEAIAEAAREALIKSQLRQNIAESVADSFEGTGWAVADSTWEGEDFRGSLHTKFVSPSGDEVVAIVHPEAAPSGEVRNRLEINFFDQANDEHFRRSRVEQITEYMEKGGVRVSAPQTRKGYETGPGDQRVRDFEQVRRREVETASPEASRS